MRETLRDHLRLKHIVDAIHNVNSYMKGRSENDLITNSMLFFAVVKKHRKSCLSLSIRQK